MADPTKAETDAVFKVLKSKKENKVHIVTDDPTALLTVSPRCVLIAKLETRRGRV